MAPLGHATVVLDHFHAVWLTSAVVDQVRRRVQQATLGHWGRKPDPLYRIRKLLLTAAEQLAQRGRARLQAGLAAGDPIGEVAAAWQGKELLCAVYAASDLADAGPRWTASAAGRTASGWRSCRVLPTVRVWAAEILAFHATTAAPTGRPKP